MIQTRRAYVSPSACRSKIRRARAFVLRRRRNVEGTSERATHPIPGALRARRGASNEAVAPSFLPSGRCVRSEFSRSRWRGVGSWSVARSKGVSWSFANKFSDMRLFFERNKSWNLKKDARHQQKKEGGRIVHGAAAQDGLLLFDVSETRKIATIVMPTVPTDNVSGPKFLAK